MPAPAISVFASGLGFIEGPVWDARSETLRVVSIDRGCVNVLDAAGHLLECVATGGGPNGLAQAGEVFLVAQNGGIFGASGPATPGVQRLAAEGVAYVFADGFDAPNDLAFGPDGKLYVTDPASARAIMEPVQGRVLACDLATGGVSIVIEGRHCPNGLAFTEDGRHLLLALTYDRLVERFIMYGDKQVSEGVHCRLANGRPDGMALDMAGNLWVCTPGTGGLEVFAPDGTPLQRIEFGPGTMTTNICFGGDERRDVFVTAAGTGSVMTFRADVPGLPLRCG